MRLLRENVGSFKEDLQLETAAHMLALTVSLGASTFDEVTFNKMKISISLVTPGAGERVVIPKMSLRDAFNIASHGEGFFVWKEKLLKGYIQLSKDGSVALTDGAYVSINYEGFPADASTSILAIDVLARAEKFNHIEEIAINGSAKELTVADKDAIYIPVTDADGNGVDKIEVQYNGRAVTYLEEELIILNNSMNDLACVLDEQLDAADGTIRQIKFGYDRLLKLPVTAALEVRITPKTKNTISIYTEKAVSIK